MLGAALRLVAIAVQFLASISRGSCQSCSAAAAGFAASKIVKAVQAGILGVALAAGTAGPGTMQRLGGQAAKLAGDFKAGAVKAFEFAKSILLSAFNTGKQIAAFVAQKAAMIGAAIAQKAMAAAQWLPPNIAMDANPIGLLVVGIGALVAGVVLAYQHFKPFRDILDAVGRVLRAVGEGIVHGLGADSTGSSRTGRSSSRS